MLNTDNVNVKRNAIGGGREDNPQPSFERWVAMEVISNG